MATSITFDSEHNLMLLEDTDKFRLYIKPDIWQDIIAQDVHTDVDNLAKMLWLAHFMHSGITVNHMGFTITEKLPAQSLTDLPMLILDFAEFSDTDRLIERIKHNLNGEFKDQEFRQIDDDFDLRRAMW